MTRLVTFKEQSLADCSNSLGIKILITINLCCNMERSIVQDQSCIPPQQQKAHTLC